MALISTHQYLKPFKILEEDNEKKKIFLIMIGSLLLLILMYIYILPNFRPVRVLNLINGSSFYIYSDHAEVDQYFGKKEIVEIPDKIYGKKITKIRNFAFSWNKNIKKVIISDYVEEIGSGAFSKCKYLEEIELGTNVKSINRDAFSDDYMLRKVNFPDKLENIENGAFYSCKELKKCELPNSVKKIGYISFDDSGVEEVVLPEGLESIGIWSFSDTPWMEKQGEYSVTNNQFLVNYSGQEEIVVIPDGVVSVNANFRDDKNIKEIYIPESVKKIGGRVFEDCTNLKVYIPASVNWINEDDYVDEVYKGITQDVSQLTIVTTKGSYAEQYAREKGIKCEIVDRIEYPQN